MNRKVVCDGGYLRIQFDFDPRLVELVRGLPGRHFDREEKSWTVPKEHVVAVVELLQDKGFSFDEAARKLYEDHRSSAGQDLTVSQLNSRVRTALRQAFPTSLWVVGEVQGYEKSAHKNIVGFRLVERRDDGRIVAEVNAVLFPKAHSLIERKLARAGNPFRLEDEVKVRVLVQVELKVDWGEYQVIVQDLDINYTLGEVARRRDEIVRKLTKEGLIDRNKSLPFPLVPLRVGLITSLGSDAEKDVLKTLHESGYAFQVTVHGARVQGPSTEASVLHALDWFRAHMEEFDVVLICRGGGSRTDLAWFDSEALGRAVATFPLPVVVGIGHEEDRSVLDEVGWRAKTPTAAAQLLVERVRETLEHLGEALERVLSGATAQLVEAGHAEGERARRLARAVKSRLVSAEADLARLSRALPRAVGTALGGQRQYLVQVRGRLRRSARRELAEAADSLKKTTALLGPRALALLSRENERLESRKNRLSALDPRRVVERGFAVLRLVEGRVVTNPAQAPPGTKLRAEIKRGVLKLLSEGGESHGTGRD
jgi:exodeoxyribonuclease VII large subunit